MRTNLRVVKKNQILGEARDVRGKHRQHEQVLGHKVAVGDAVHRVVAVAREAELGSEPGTVDAQSAAGQRARAERRHVDAQLGVAQALGVAQPGKGVRQQPVAVAHGLSGLEVREARHESVDVLFRVRSDGGAQRREQTPQTPRRGAQPKTRVEHDLFVARPTRVQFATHRADQRSQLALVGRVHVLVRGAINDKRACAPQRRHLTQTVDQRLCLVLGKHAHARQLACVRRRAAQIFAPQASIDVD